MIVSNQLLKQPRNDGFWWETSEWHILKSKQDFVFCNKSNIILPTLLPSEGKECERESCVALVWVLSRARYLFPPAAISISSPLAVGGDETKPNGPFCTTTLQPRYAHYTSYTIHAHKHTKQKIRTKTRQHKPTDSTNCYSVPFHLKKGS